MRENILIYSHNTHNFLKSEMIHASSVFEKVVVICPKNKEIRDVAKDLCNVEVISFNKKELYQNVIYSLPRVLHKEKIIELKDAYKKKLFSFEYIKHFLMFLSLEKILEKSLNYKLKLSEEDSKKWVLYSAWYYGTAYATTQVKSKYDGMKVVSLAHSFEIDQEKNAYTSVLFRKYYHNKLDGLYFISENVYEMYKNQVAKKLNLSIANVEIKYLGTKKLFEGISKISDDGILRITSCSHLVPIKRVDLIFQALNEIKELKIEWTHIGDGKQMEYLKNLVLNRSNKNLTVNLLGSMDNKEIHKYYLENSVDLFINTSKSEGIPVAIMEAIAYGVPVIATDVGGNSEIVKHDFGRLLSKNPTIEEVKKEIMSLYNLPQLRKTEMKKNAYQFFINNFNADNIRKDFFTELRKY